MDVPGVWFSLWLAIAQYAPTRDQRLWATEKAVAWIEAPRSLTLSGSARGPLAASAACGIPFNPHLVF